MLSQPEPGVCLNPVSELSLLKSLHNCEEIL